MLKPVTKFFVGEDTMKFAGEIAADPIKLKASA